MTPPRLALCGTNAVLMEMSQGKFSLEIQRRLWSMCREGGALSKIQSVRHIQLGVNNVLVSFDPQEKHPSELKELLIRVWSQAAPSTVKGKLLEVPVIYGMAEGSELETVANNASMTIEETIALHTSVEYHVACIGSVPGFAYLVGLPDQLVTPRRTVPRTRVPKGAVGIGGPQTGVMPMDMPSGWNLIGMTHLDMFDPQRENPSLLSPGDRVRFIPKSSLK